MECIWWLGSVQVIIHSVTYPSVITECLVQIIIHSEDKELSRDVDPSLIVIRRTVVIVKTRDYYF